MNKKLLIWVFALVLIVSSVSAQLIFKANDEADIKIPCFNNGTYCSSSAICNITSSYPNTTIFINNQAMTNQISYHNYTLDSSKTNIIGIYPSSVICNDNGNLGKDTFDLKITGNGKEDAQGSVIVLFAILFLGLLFYCIIMIFKSLGHIVELDLDILDLGLLLGGYFALLGLYMLEKVYLGNLDIEGFLELFIKVGAWTNCYLPILFFILSMFRRMSEGKKLNARQL